VLWSLNGFRARPSAHNHHSCDFVPPLATYRPQEISAAGVSHASEPKRGKALRSAGIQRHDAGSTPAAYGGELDVVLSFVRISEDDESEARAKGRSHPRLQILKTSPPNPQRSSRLTGILLGLNSCAASPADKAR
jgi:hypothetical protein